MFIPGHLYPIKQNTIWTDMFEHHLASSTYVVILTIPASFVLDTGALKRQLTNIIQKREYILHGIFKTASIIGVTV